MATLAKILGSTDLCCAGTVVIDDSWQVRLLVVLSEILEMITVI